MFMVNNWAVMQLKFWAMVLKMAHHIGSSPIHGTPIGETKVSSKCCAVKTIAVSKEAFQPVCQGPINRFKYFELNLQKKSTNSIVIDFVNFSSVNFFSRDNFSQEIRRFPAKRFRKLDNFHKTLMI